LQETVKPTIIIQIDTVDGLLSSFARYADGKLWSEHPSLVSAQRLAESVRFSAAAARSAFWPRLQLSARTSLDYPNTMVPETINQNTFGANLSWPLFDGFADRNRLESLKSQELSVQARQEQLARSLFRDWAKARDQLAALNGQMVLAKQAAFEAKELASITYRSYRAGALTYLELNNANYKVLEAELQLAKVQIQILMNQAVLASLTSTETQPQVSDFTEP
jgi:outer membrane protein TolC